MKSMIRLSMCAAILAGHGAAVSAAPPQLQCPATIKPVSMTVDSPPGWVPFAAVPLPLHSAGMSAGPPSSLLRLRGEPVNESKRAFSTRYTLDGSGFEEGKWLDCFYGDAGELPISRRLDDRLKLCTITLYAPKRGEPRRIGIDCK